MEIKDVKLAPTLAPLATAAIAPAAKEDSAVEVVQAVQDFTDKLTITRIFMVLLTGLLITLTMLTYENRDKIFQLVTSGSASNRGADPILGWDVSPKSREDLIGLVKNSKNISLVMVTEVDLQKNRRTPRFWFLDDPSESDIRLRTASILPQAVFDYDPKNTQQMVGVLNNEFVCSHFADTVYQRVFPEMTKKMSTICRLAIPPFYGRFVGILTIGLREQPSKDELDSIRIEASRLAVEIYLRDVVKKPIPGAVAPAK